MDTPFLRNELSPEESPGLFTVRIVSSPDSPKVNLWALAFYRSFAVLCRGAFYMLPRKRAIRESPLQHDFYVASLLRFYLISTKARGTRVGASFVVEHQGLEPWTDRL